MDWTQTEPSIALPLVRMASGARIDPRIPDSSKGLPVSLEVPQGSSRRQSAEFPLEVRVPEIEPGRQPGDIDDDRGRSVGERG